MCIYTPERVTLGKVVKSPIVEIDWIGLEERHRAKEKSVPLSLTSIFSSFGEKFLEDLMIHQLGSASIIVFCKYVAGIAEQVLFLSYKKSPKGQHLLIIVRGNIFAIGLFVSPFPTFRRIIRNQSTEQFSGLPYIYSLLNCLITMWYGTPLVSSNNTMVLTVNLVGTFFQLGYIILYISYADKDRKFRIAGLLVAVLSIFTIVVGGSLQIGNLSLRRIIVGLLSCGALISMFASPLFIINLVIRTKSVEFMPFYLSLSTFLMSASFFIYGLLNQDPFVYIPNGLGTVLGLTQLVLYFHFKHRERETLTEPLIESCDRTV